MTCPACPRERTATLLDGRQVCTWCEAWRHECEARAVLAMPHVDARRAYLAAVAMAAEGMPVAALAAAFIADTTFRERT